MWAASMRRGVGGALALGMLAFTVAVTGTRLERPVASSSGAADLVYLPDARLLRPLVLGYDHALADLIWFRTISYFGEHYEGDKLYPWLAKMCDIVTDLDPRAEHVYRFAGLVLPWEARQVEDGIRLLEKGLGHLPRSWSLHYNLGIVHYLFTHDYERAVTHLQRAAELPGSPPNVARFAALLHTRQHGSQTTIEILRQMREQTTSPETREVLDRSIQDAQVTWDVERLDGLVRMLRERTGTPPASLGALVAAGLLRAVPPDPYGGTYEIDPATGRVRSSTGRTPRALTLSPRARRMLDPTESVRP